jgi:hypothetical protein
VALESFILIEGLFLALLNAGEATLHRRRVLHLRIPGKGGEALAQ